MTHFEIYNQIIENRKSNPLPEEQYGEKHHIVPKSVCPLLEKSKDNIVRLSAQEHFLAHYHLWLAYRDELKEKKWAIKMCFAFHRMKQQLLKCDDVESMAKLYEEVRVEQGKIIRTMKKGISRSDVVKRKISESEKGKYVSQETREKLRNRKLGNKNALGHTLSDESKEIIRVKLSEKFSGKNNPAFGRHWYTNGKTNLYLYDTECPIGFHRGITRKSNLTNDKSLLLQEE